MKNLSRTLLAIVLSTLLVSQTLFAKADYIDSTPLYACIDQIHTELSQVRKTCQSSEVIKNKATIAGFVPTIILFGLFLKNQLRANRATGALAYVLDKRADNYFWSIVPGAIFHLPLAYVSTEEFLKQTDPCNKKLGELYTQKAVLESAFRIAANISLELDFKVLSFYRKAKYPQGQEINSEVPLEIIRELSHEIVQSAQRGQCHI